MQVHASAAIAAPGDVACACITKEEGRCKATWTREFEIPLREAGPPNHHDDKVDSDQQVVNEELSLCQSHGAEEASVALRLVTWGASARVCRSRGARRGSVRLNENPLSQPTLSVSSAARGLALALGAVPGAEAPSGAQLKRFEGL